MAEHALDREMGLAGIGRPEHGGDTSTARACIAIGRRGERDGHRQSVLGLADGALLTTGAKQLNLWGCRRPIFDFAVIAYSLNKAAVASTSEGPCQDRSKFLRRSGIATPDGFDGLADPRPARSRL